MNHQHFDSLNSTQTFLKENLSSLGQHGANILVSTDRQTNGIGRTGAQWVDFENNLAFSFTLSPSEPVTLSSLELAVLIVKYFEKNWQTKLKLKWPNDLLNKNAEKCAGIILHNANNQLICGVGINISAKRDEVESVVRDESKPAIGSISEKNLIANLNKKNISREIYQFILDNRLPSNTIVQEWNALCVHLNMNVRIYDSSTSFIEGKFIGLGTIGEALIESNQGEISKIYSGSLIFSGN